MRMPHVSLSVIAAALFVADVAGAEFDRFSATDHRFLDPLIQVAGERGYFLRPDYEPADAPYRTVMTFTKMMTKHQSITMLLAQDRFTKEYFVIVFDLPKPSVWSRESLRLRDAAQKALPATRVRLTKGWMEDYASNQALERTDSADCA